MEEENESKKIPDVTKKWHYPINPIYKIIVGILFIGGVGYKISEHRNNFDTRMLTHELKLECNEKLQVERNRYEERSQALRNKRNDEIIMLVKDLESKIDKNEK